MCYAGVTRKGAVAEDYFFCGHCGRWFYQALHPFFARQPRRASPGRLVLEGRFPPETIRELKRRGHDVEVGGDWSEGRMCAASQQDGLLKAAANPRGMQGYAAGR